MKTILYYSLLLSTFTLISCQETARSKMKPSELNLELSKEIDKMSNADQQMQLNMLRFMTADIDQYNMVEKTRDQVYAKNSKRVSEILDEFGYPDYNLVGKKSSDNFYTLVSHSGQFPEIKKKAIAKFKETLSDDNSRIEMYANLVDQTALEQNLPSEYGSIVHFKKNGQAYNKNLRDSSNVDSRRIEIGLDSLKYYMNSRSVDYFIANKESLLQQGITKPILYN